MPTILSKQLKAKLLGSDWSFGYNCYEVGHTWTPNCSEAALEVSLAAGLRVLPLYALLYGFSQIVVLRRFDARTNLETLKSILRSSSFIFFHLYSGSLIGCTFRNTTGRFYYRLLVLLPGLMSSYMSLLIEKPSRRQALAFYLLNMASEIVFRMIVNGGYIRPIKHGETMLFAVSLAAWYHLIRTHGFGHDPVSGAAKYLIGREEAKSRAKGDGKLMVTKQITEKNLFVEALATRVGGRHESCPHSESACLFYIVKPMPTRFLAGCLIQTLLKLTSKPMELMRSPIKTIYSATTSRQTIRFGLFLTTLVAGGRLTSCLLRRYSDSNDCDWHAAVSGLVAGCSMFWSPKSSLSMYIMWKAVEQHFLIATNDGKVPYFDFTVLTIYSLSAATLLYTFALEPSLMRPSYMKFLDNISDHRLHQLNRMVLDVFGTGSSKGYEDYFPDLDLKFMSNQFKELIFNWMIQPYQ